MPIPTEPIGSIPRTAAGKSAVRGAAGHRGIFQGSRDKAIPKGFAQRALTLIPRSKVVTVESGHFIPLNNPEAVAAELLSIFAGAAEACADVTAA
jgi:hypothetical protein